MTKPAIDQLNRELGSARSTLLRIGARRVMNLGILVVVLVAGSIFAIATDGSRLFLQRVFDGLNNGFIYAAVSLSLVLIFKATGIVNFAQGEMAMLGTFIAYILAVEHNLPVVLAIILAMVISGVAAA